MEKLKSGNGDNRACIGYNDQFLRFPCRSLFIVAKSDWKSSWVYSTCGILKDSNKSINRATLMSASFAALPIETSFLWKSKRATDSLTTWSGSVSPTDFMLLRRVFSSFMNTF